MPGRLAGNVALVTGGASGIGRGICLRFAEEGAAVCSADSNEAGSQETAALVRERGGSVHVVEADVTAPEDCLRMVAETVAALGRLDIVVANAGIGRGGTLLEGELRNFQEVLNVNVSGVFLTVQAAARTLVAQGTGGKIIITSSVAAQRPGSGMGAYSASKAAVVSLTRSWAQQLAEHHINVNAIGPGLIDTPLTAPMIRGRFAPPDAGATIPWGRVGTPQDVAHVALFLASQESDFVTGQVIYVDGGATAH